MKADQTRVEAVAGPLYDHLRDQVDDETARAAAMEIAQRQIQANDVWMTERGWKPTPRAPSDAMLDGQVIWRAESCWAVMWDAAPSPEETGR